MIKCKKGMVAIEGSRLGLMADLICIMQGLIQEKVMTKEEIVKALDVATMSESEREDAIKNAVSDIFAEIFKEDK